MLAAKEQCLKFHYQRVGKEEWIWSWQAVNCPVYGNFYGNRLCRDFENNDHDDDYEDDNDGVMDGDGSDN